VNAEGTELLLVQVPRKPKESGWPAAMAAL
jgi:hypothetical protein